MIDFDNLGSTSAAKTSGIISPRNWDIKTRECNPCPENLNDPRSIEWHEMRFFQKRREVYKAICEFDTEPGSFYKKLSSLGITYRLDTEGDIVNDKLDDDNDPGSFYKKLEKLGIDYYDKKILQSNELTRRRKISQIEKEIEDPSKWRRDFLCKKLAETDWYVMRQEENRDYDGKVPIQYQIPEEVKKEREELRDSIKNVDLYTYNNAELKLFLKNTKNEKSKEIEKIKKEGETEWKYYELKGRKKIESKYYKFRPINKNESVPSYILAAMDKEEQDKKDKIEKQKKQKIKDHLSSFLIYFISLIFLCSLIFIVITFVVSYPVFTCVSLVIIALISRLCLEPAPGGYSKPDYIGEIKIWKN